MSASPVAIVLSSDGSTAYTANDKGDDFISVIDVANRSVAREIPISPTGYAARDIALSPDGQLLYVVRYDANALIIVDSVSGETIATVTVGGGPNQVALSSDGLWAYVTNLASASVSVVDTRSFEVVKNVEVRSPSGIVIPPGSEFGYVTSLGGIGAPGLVTALDIRTNEIVNQVEVTEYPARLAVVGDRYVYAADSLHDVVSVIDMQSAKILKQIPIVGPSAIEASVDGADVFVASRSENQVARIDAQSLTVDQIYDTDAGPVGIAIGPAGQALIANSIDDTVSVVAS